MLAEQTKTALGSGSGRSRNSWAQNFACKSAQGKMATASHVNSAHDNSISEATEAISACRNQFRARSIKTKGTNFGSIKMYMVEVFVHANPADGQPTQHARDFKLGCVLTSPRQFHQDNSGHQNAGLTGITLADGREWRNSFCTSHTQCVTFVTVTKCHKFEFWTYKMSPIRIFDLGHTH